MSNGKLLVVTGFSGSGKDTVIDSFLAKSTSFRRLITCADRVPREGEIHGVHYYFVSTDELDRMDARGELVEKPLTYGTSRKATPKAEFKKIIRENASLVWRIESSLAAFVASGKFFDEQFSPEESAVLKKASIVVFLTAKKPELIARRKKRDLEKYDFKEFARRDKQDALILKKFGKVFKNIIENEEGKVEETVDKILKLIQK